MSKKMPTAASALNTLRGKHLRALEQLNTALRDLEQARASAHQQRNLEAERKVWESKMEALKGEISSCRDQMAKFDAEREIMAGAAARNAEELKQWEDRCADLTERIASQKSAFVQASDEMNALRNELSGLKQRHQNEIAALTEASSESASALQKLRDRAERLEGSKAVGEDQLQKLNDEISRLKTQLSQVRRSKQLDRDRAAAAEEATRNLNAKLAAEHKAAFERVQKELREAQTEILTLRKSQGSDGLALRRAKETIKQLEVNVQHESQRASFLEKSLEAAKGEWSKLANENSTLKARLAQLEQIAQGGSKFAKFVSLKEENQKLANQHARLRKAHIKLKKGVAARSAKRSFGAPLQPKRPETTHR